VKKQGSCQAGGTGGLAAGVATIQIFGMKRSGRSFVDRTVQMRRLEKD